MVPMDLHVVRARLLLLFNYVLSKKHIMFICMNINAYDEDVAGECNNACN